MALRRLGAAAASASRRKRFRLERNSPRRAAFWARVRSLVLAGLLALFCTGSARAASVSMGYDEDPSGGAAPPTARFIAGAGEANRLTVTLAGGVARFSDPGATITAGSACASR